VRIEEGEKGEEKKEKMKKSVILTLRLVVVII